MQTVSIKILNIPDEGITRTRVLPLYMACNTDERTAFPLACEIQGCSIAHGLNETWALNCVPGSQVLEDFQAYSHYYRAGITGGSWVVHGWFTGGSRCF